MLRFRSLVAVSVAGFVIAGCSNSSPSGPHTTPFLKGHIGLVVNSTGRALTMFQLAAPKNTEVIALGASATVTPVGFSLKGTTAIVPLGDAASTAVINLKTATITRYFVFSSGNATGQAFVDDTTVILANATSNYVGRVTLDQAADAITDTAMVAQSPTDIQVANGNAYVISAVLNAQGSPTGVGAVTKLNGQTLAVLATAQTTDSNSSAAAIGPDGRLYVVNTGTFVNQSTITVMDTATLAVINTYQGFGIGAGAITIDAAGLAYISSFFSGTVIWNTVTHTFVRSNTNALCVTVGGNCLGAFGAATDAAGDVYQTFFGTQAQAPYVYVYGHGSYAVTDSIAVGQGPTQIRIATF
ncbi:MAG TPA: hypothetical protein VNW46_13585 [Gemmatimonadaceae bacterium]|nr:hypothetical protein [Gemmatimonadaceae bacterium]